MLQNVFMILHCKKNSSIVIYSSIFLLININRYAFIINSESGNPRGSDIRSGHRCSHPRNESASIKFTGLNLLINFQKSEKYLFHLLT